MLKWGLSGQGSNLLKSDRPFTSTTPGWVFWPPLKLDCRADEKTTTFFYRKLFAHKVRSAPKSRKRSTGQVLEVRRDRGQVPQCNATRLDVSLLLPGLRSEENFRRGFRAPPLAHSQADRWVVRPPVRTVVGKPENTTLKPYPAYELFLYFWIDFRGTSEIYVAPSLTCKAVHAVACTTTADRTRPSLLAHSLVCYHVCSRHVVRTVCGLLICAPPAPPPLPTPPPPLL